MKYPRTEDPNELHVVNSLVTEMRRIVVEPEAPVSSHRRDRAFGGCEVEGDLSGMDFEGKVDVDAIERLKNRAKTPGEVLKSLLPEILRRRRKRINGVPDRRPREAVDDSRRSV